MRRGLAWLGGALGLAALLRLLGREQAQQPRPAADPAAELRARLEQAREASDDRDEFDAAEGQPVDEVEHARPPAPPEPEVEPEPEAEAEPEPPLSLDERRRAIHEKAQQALGEMQRPGADE
ncbi:MAG: hypothetical protein ACRDNB_03720 [Gaiellaceae bacterium]